MTIIRCVSCDGFGWTEDDDDGSAQDCAWCGGVGYVYHENGIDRRIPPTDYAAVSDQLEALELERMREMGYSGSAKKPWDQPVRQERGNLLRGKSGT